MELVRFSTFKQIILEGQMSWTDIRLKGSELAQNKNVSIRTEVFNDALNKWETVATNKPNGWTINIWGDILKVKADGNGYDIIHRNNH